MKNQCSKPTIEQFTFLAKETLWIFPKLVSGFQSPYYLRKCCEIFIELFHKKTDKIKVLIIDGPPRHGKTEQFPIHGTAWLLGHFPWLKIIIGAYSSNLAERHSAAARDIFEKWGPILWGSMPSKSVFGRGLWQTEKGGECLAAGLDAGASGFGADVFFIDDYHKTRKQAESPVERERNWSWWQSVTGTRIHPNAVIAIFATRWHDDDLVGRLLAQHKELGEDSPYELVHIVMPALADKNDFMGRKKGEALWPWRYNRQRLLNAKKMVGPYDWSALFQGSPTLRGGTLFKSQYFRYYEFDAMTKEYICHRFDKEPIRIKKNELIRHEYCDPAIEIKKTSDPTGMAAWGYSGRYRVWLLLDRINERIEHTQVNHRLKLFAFKNDCSKIGIENEKLGKVLVKQSAGNDKINGRSIPFVEIPTGGLDKYARATPMAGYVENERVFFPKYAPWLSDYETNLVKFPNTDEDEDVDITSMAEHMESKRSLAEVLGGC